LRRFCVLSADRFFFPFPYTIPFVALLLPSAKDSLLSSSVGLESEIAWSLHVTFERFRYPFSVAVRTPRFLPFLTFRCSKKFKGSRLPPPPFLRGRRFYGKSGSSHPKFFPPTMSCGAGSSPPGQPFFFFLFCAFRVSLRPSPPPPITRRTKTSPSRPRGSLTLSFFVPPTSGMLDGKSELCFFPSFVRECTDVAPLSRFGRDWSFSMPSRPQAFLFFPEPRCRVSGPR